MLNQMFSSMFINLNYSERINLNKKKLRCKLLFLTFDNKELDFQNNLC